MKVSVVITAFNSEKYIDQAIESVLSQTQSDFELIICNDASTDRTRERVNAWMERDARVFVIDSEENHGPSYARNRAMEHACGTWIALLDADDFYDPGRLARMTTLGDQYQADMIADNIYYVDESGEVKGWAMSASNTSRVRTLTAQSLMKQDVPGYFGFKYGYLKPIIRREFLLREDVHYDEEVRVGEDFLLYLDCLEKGAKFVVVSEPYYYYRETADSLTRMPKNRNLEILKANNFRRLERYRENGLVELERLAERRQRLYEEWVLYRDVVAKLRERNGFEALTDALKRPSAWGFFLRMLCFRSIQRISRSKSGMIKGFRSAP